MPKYKSTENNGYVSELWHFYYILYEESKNFMLDMRTTDVTPSCKTLMKL